MLEASADHNTPSGADPAGNRTGRTRWQIGLQTLCLLIVAVAVWTTFAVNRQQNAFLETKLAVLQPLARELVIDDPAQIAIVKLEELWMGDHQWDIYLPEGRYRLCLATHKIDQSGLAPVVQSAFLAGGRHHVALEQKEIDSGWQVIARWDGTGQLTANEPKTWDTGASSTSGESYAISTQLSSHTPTILIRTQFSVPRMSGVSSTSMGPADGILLWLEKAKP